MESCEHFIPDVGAIRAEFFNESATLYRFLSRRGEIKRTQGLAQLGIVQHTWPMARHTRWDFTMLMLDLVRRARELQSVHLTSHVNLGPGLRMSSSRELINCWALLLSIGHLHGTFAAETEILFGIRRSDNWADFRDELLACVPDGAPKDWASRVLDQERTFQFHQLLAFYRLSRLGGDADDHSFWQDVLGAYVAERADESQALTRTRTLFRRVRRLAFLTLDASVTPGPVEIRLAQVTSSPKALERLLVRQSDWAGEDELLGLEEYLNREVYHGREVLTQLAALRPEIRRRVETNLVRHGLRHVVESSAANDHLLLPPASDRAQTLAVVRGYVGGPYLRFLREERPRPFDRRSYEEAFRRWARLVGSSASVVLVRNAAGTQLIFQTHVHGPAPRNEACAIVGATRLTERLRSAWSNQLPSGIAAEIISQQVSVEAAKGVVVAALQHAFDSAVYWEWDESSRGPQCVIGSKATVLAQLERLHEATHSRARRTELNALLARARSIQASVLVVPCVNLTCYAESSSQQVGEVDGLIVGVDARRSDLVIGLVEAKYTTGAEGKARGQLSDLVNTLDSSAWMRKGRLQSSVRGREGCAWVYFRSRYTR